MTALKSFSVLLVCHSAYNTLIYFISSTAFPILIPRFTNVTKGGFTVTRESFTVINECKFIFERTYATVCTSVMFLISWTLKLTGLI